MAAATSVSANSSRRQLRLPMPHPGQQIVLRHPARFKWLDAGRRWNKTTLDMHVAVERAAQGREVFWGAPTYDQVRVGWNEMLYACGGVAEFNQSRLEVRFPTGGLVRFRSLDDPDNARGFTAHDAIIDEAAKVSERAWYEVIRPMLMSTGGTALINGTPNGRNWFWRECMRAQNGSSGDAVAWLEVPTLGAQIIDGALVRVPHAMENPRIAWSELEQMFETLPERVFRQEILAEFLDDAGGVFRNVDACVTAGTLDPHAAPSHPQRRYVMGVDLAKHADFTVCVVADQLDKRIVAFDRWNKSDWPLQKARIAGIAARWNDALIHLDSTGIGDVVYDDLRAAGLRVQPYTFTAASKEQLVNHAVLLVEQRQVSIPAVPVLVNELKSLEYQQSKASGRYRIAAPEGMHDDAAMAFCLCCWGLGHGGGLSLGSRALDELLAPQPISGVGGLRHMGRRF